MRVLFNLNSENGFVGEVILSISAVYFTQLEDNLTDVYFYEVDNDKFQYHAVLGSYDVSLLKSNFLRYGYIDLHHINFSEEKWED